MQRRIDSERTAVRSGLSVGEVGERYVDPPGDGDGTKADDDLATTARCSAPTSSASSASARSRRSTPTGSPPTSPPERRRACRRRRSSNQLVFLHGLFAFALKRGWIAGQSGAGGRPTRRPAVDPDIRYLELDELEALLRAVPDGPLRPRPTARALPGRGDDRPAQGELVALRWSTSTGRPPGSGCAATTPARQFGTPKSRRSTRARCRWPTASPPPSSAISSARAYQADDDLVFAHPADRPPARRLGAAQRATRPRCKAAGLRDGPLPRPAPHLRHPHAPPPGCRCGRCRSGWATATTRPRNLRRLRAQLPREGAP